MKSDYRIRAKHLFEELYPYIEHATEPDDYIDGVWEYNLAHDRRVRVRYGKTRIVFLCADYVIKIDYGCYGRELGTCMDELYRYLQACDDGYDDVLMPITQEVYHNQYYYIMPRAKGMMPHEDDSWIKFVDDDTYYWISDHIYDLHTENYVIVNNKVKIFDYACGTIC